MFDIVLFSVLEVACAFAPTLGVLLGLRFLFGIAMGGEWGIGASLAMESIPAKSRGFVSGLLQSGYPCGFFLAALANWLLVDHIGMARPVRGRRAACVARAVHPPQGARVARVEGRRTQARESVFESMRGHWKLFVYLMLLMAAFNMFSHGSQDMYPTFVQETLKIPAGSGTAFMLTALLNLGALAGGLTFGSLSERIGRRKAIIIAALLSIPVIPLWTYGGSLLLLGLGAFLIQVMVQGAWGVVPTHLNELSPDAVRGTLPGFAYQMGNLLAAITATAQTWLADQRGGDFAFAMSTWIAAVALLLALLTWLGPEARGVGFGRRRDPT